jgi:hypothetical protein
MANTYFVDGVTPIVSTWLNDVNNYVYQGRQRATVVAISGQTVFTLPFSYTVGANTLDVYINGVRQILNSSYTETNITTVTFSESVPVTANVEFIG